MSPSETIGSSQTSTSRPRGFFDEGTRKAYAKSVKTVATAGSALIEARAGAGTGGFLMLPDEADDIADPASRLLARHMPVEGTGRISDLGDVVALVVAAFGYLMAGLGRRTAALLGVGAEQGPADEPPTGPAQPEPTTVPVAPPWPTPARPPAVG